MLAWLRANGAALDGVDVRRAPGGARGLYASAAIAAGDELARVPARCVLRAPATGEGAGEEAYLRLARELVTQRALVAQVGAGMAFMAPYLESLPDASAELACVDLYWEEEERVLLAHAAAARRMAARQAQVDAAAAAADVPADALRDAAALVCSRVFGGGSGSELVPLMDLANHAPTADAAARIAPDEDGGYAMVALRDISEGEEITHSYRGGADATGGEDGRPLGERAEAAIWYRLTRRLFFAAAQVAYAEGEKAPAVVDAVGELALRSGGLGADEQRAQAVLRAHTAAARRAVESGMGAVAAATAAAAAARDAASGGVAGAAPADTLVPRQAL
eukprot:PRCOL_00006970-RA